jgi:hypothetical protein
MKRPILTVYEQYYLFFVIFQVLWFAFRVYIKVGLLNILDSNKIMYNFVHPYDIRHEKSCTFALTEHHAMKAYWGGGGIAPFIL